MNLAVEMIDKNEIIRSELEAIIPTLTKKADIKEAERLASISEEVAGKLYDIHLTGAREDAFRAPMKLYGRLSALASDINASGIDYQPTNQQGEVYEVLNRRLLNVQEEFQQLIDEDINMFNQKLNNLDQKIDIEKKLDEVKQK
jgi:5,10-methenyltetrahydromethanopterin hydrogenase